MELLVKKIYIEQSHSIWSLIFLPTPLVVAWVNILTFSSPPPSLSPPHHQLFISFRYRGVGLLL